MNPDLIIFDCDGTLVDSEYLNNLATVELLAEQGLHQYDMDYAFEHFVGIKFSTILKNITAETGHVFPGDMRERYIERAMALVPQYLKPVPGAAAFVAVAKSKMKIAVASNGQRDNVLFTLEKTGLLHHFDPNYIFTFSDVKNAKPAPDLFLLAAEKHGVSPARSLVIEDSVVGVTAGAAAGMVVYGFTGTHQNPEAYGKKLENAGATRVYASFTPMQKEIFG